MNDMPRDPFHDEVPDLSGAAAGLYSMFTSLVAAGFTEYQATQMVVQLISATMTGQNK